MVRTIVINPISRVTGHLRLEVRFARKKITKAFVSGGLFRGFENLLKNKRPRDIIGLVQRICGPCSTSHSLAATTSLESLIDFSPSKNTIIIRNLQLGANFLLNHINHFYCMALFDYVEGPKVPPFTSYQLEDCRLSRKENERFISHYFKALKIREKCARLHAILSGKMPHGGGVVLGTTSQKVTADLIVKFFGLLKEIQDFINNTYVVDVVKLVQTYKDYFEIGRGYKNLLSFGAFDLDSKSNPLKRKKFFSMGVFSKDKTKALHVKRIKESIRFSYYQTPSRYLRSKTARHPFNGSTQPFYGKEGAYSWVKSARYDREAYEVGPLSRMMVTHLLGNNQKISRLINEVMSHFNFKGDISPFFSVMGRHIIRAMEAKVIAEEMAGWILNLDPKEKIYRIDYIMPENKDGFSILESPGGAVGHWIQIRDSAIKNYQIIGSGGWNASPRDDNNQPGPIEKALEDVQVKDRKDTLMLLRIARSFDPCMNCAIH